MELNINKQIEELNNGWLIMVKTKIDWNVYMLLIIGIVGLFFKSFIPMLVALGLIAIRTILKIQERKEIGDYLESKGYKRI